MKKVRSLLFPSDLSKPSHEVGVVYEDDTLLVVDKPAHLLVHPNVHNKQGPDLLNILQRGRPKLFLINRLDRQTSGLVLLSKKKELVTLFQEQWHGPNVYKAYHCLVRGHPPAPYFFSDRPLSDLETKIKKDCYTLFQVLKTSPKGSLLRAIPLTGRTHQIRRHLAHHKLHIIGDTVYGKGRINQAARAEGLCRLFLHCSELSFTHPTNQKRYHFHLPLPRECQHYLELINA